MLTDSYNASDVWRKIGTVTFASSFAYNKKQVKLMNPEENINVG